MDGLRKIYISKSRTFLAFCFAFIIGVGLFSFSDNLKFAFYLYLVLFASISCTILIWTNETKRFFLVCAIFFIIGGLRYFFSIPAETPAHLRYFNGERKEITGYISEEPEYKIDQSKYIIKTNLGKALVALPNYPQYNYGDVLTLNCLLQSPKDVIDSTFVYSKYLARDQIYTICSGPKIKSVKIGEGGNIFKKALLNLKKKSGEQVEKLWPEPESSLMAGLLYGARTGLPQELLDNFSRVGITHIIAVSGFNITIIASILLSGLIWIGFSRPRAFWLAVAGIFLFVLFTGASSSVVRAGIMGVLVLVAGQLGRLSRISNVLVLTAAFMLLLNPFVLVWDAGFQLSFLSTLGLVFLSPILEKYIPSSEYNFINSLREPFLSTISAICATLPLILFQFGRFSVIAPLANILILWIIPWLMLFGFMALVVSWIIFPLGELVAWIAILGLKYVIILSAFLGGLDWSAYDLKIPWWMMALLYGLTIWAVIKFSKKEFVP